MNQFILVTSTLLLILGFVSVLRSCYLGLNLCERNQVVSDLRGTLADDFQNVLRDYASQREQAFEVLYQQKIRLTCAQQMLKEGFDGGNLLACVGSNAGLNRTNERVLFSQTIQDTALAQPNAQPDDFYTENLSKVIDFKINLQYEPIMVEIFKELQKIDDARVENEQLPIEQRVTEQQWMYELNSTFNSAIRQKYPVNISHIESEEGVWATVFSSSKACTAQVNVGRMDNRVTAHVQYETKSETEMSGRVSSIYFGAHLKSVVGSQGVLSTPEARVNYFVHAINKQK